MNGYDACKILLGLKLHFTTDSYDFIKYDGEVAFSIEAYKKRKDRYFCEKLAHKYKTKDKLIDFASTIYAHTDKPKKLWTTNFLTEESIQIYDASIAWTDAQNYRLSEDLGNIFQSQKDNNIDDPNWCIISENGQEPPILNSYRQGFISLETVVALNDRMHLFDIWEDKIDDDILYPILKNRIMKYTPFVMKRMDRREIWQTISGTAKKYFHTT